MADVIIKLFILLVGFGFGFLVACGGAARIIAEKNDLKNELEKTKAELEAVKAVKTRVIEISDDRAGKGVKFGDF